MDFSSFHFDAWLMSRLKAPRNWEYFQKGAHRVQYSEWIVHGLSFMSVERVRREFPLTLLVHQVEREREEEEG